MVQQAGGYNRKLLLKGKCVNALLLVSREWKELEHGLEKSGRNKLVEAVTRRNLSLWRVRR